MIVHLIWKKYRFLSLHRGTKYHLLKLSSRCNERIELMTRKKIMQKRSKSAIIKTPKFQGNSEQYYYSIIMLHLPFRNESKLIQLFLSAQQAFVQKNLLVDLADIQFAAYLHDIERAVRLLSAMQEDIDPVVAPNTHDYEESHNQISDDHS